MTARVLVALPVVAAAPARAAAWLPAPDIHFTRDLACIDCHTEKALCHSTARRLS